MAITLGGVNFLNQVYKTSNLFIGWQHEFLVTQVLYWHVAMQQMGSSVNNVKKF
jgi:hypothetical protein